MKVQVKEDKEISKMMKLRFGRVRGPSALLFLVIAVLALALAAACGDDDDEEPAAAAAGQEEVAAATAAAESAESEAAAARAEAEAAQAAVAEAQTEAEAAAARATAAEAETRAAAAEARAAEAEARAAEERATAAEAVEKRGVIKIGLPFELSGIWSIYGIPEANAVRLATKEINSGHAMCDFCEPGGGVLIGDTLYTVELVERDTRSEPGPSIAAANELIEDIGVKFIIGPALDHFGIKIQELTNPRQVIMMGSPSIYSSVLTPESVRPDQPLETTKRYLWKTLPHNDVRDDILIGGMIDMIERIGGVEVNTAAILISDDLTGAEIGDSVVKWTEKVGVEVLEMVFYPPETKDFSPFLTRIKALNPDVLHLWYKPDDAVIQLVQAVELEVAKSYSMFSVEPGIVKQALPDGSNAVVAMNCLPICWGEISSQANADYWERWQASGYPLDTAAGVSGLYYDPTFMLVEAMKNAGTITDTEAIVIELEKITRNGLIPGMRFNNAHTNNTMGFDLCLEKENVWTCELWNPTAGEHNRGLTMAEIGYPEG